MKLIQRKGLKIHIPGLRPKSRAIGEVAYLCLCDAQGVPLLNNGAMALVPALESDAKQLLDTIAAILESEL